MLRATPPLGGRVLCAALAVFCFVPVASGQVVIRERVEVRAAAPSASFQAEGSGPFTVERRDGSAVDVGTYQPAVGDTLRIKANFPSCEAPSNLRFELIDPVDFEFANPTTPSDPDYHYDLCEDGDYRAWEGGCTGSSGGAVVVHGIGGNPFGPPPPSSSSILIRALSDRARVTVRSSCRKESQGGDGSPSMEVAEGPYDLKIPDGLSISVSPESVGASGEVRFTVTASSLSAGVPTSFVVADPTVGGLVPTAGGTPMSDLTVPFSEASAVRFVAASLGDTTTVEVVVTAGGLSGTASFRVVPTLSRGHSHAVTSRSG